MRQVEKSFRGLIRRWRTQERRGGTTAKSLLLRFLQQKAGGESRLGAVVVQPLAGFHQFLLLLGEAEAQQGVAAVDAVGVAAEEG